MRTEVFGIIALGLLVAACSSADERTSIGGEGANVLTEANSGQAQGAGPLRSSEHVVRQAQSELKREGLYRGKIDGIAGPDTKQAITAFRQREGLQQTAHLDQATVQRIHLKALRMMDTSGKTEASNTATEGSGVSSPPNMGQAAMPTSTVTGTNPPADDTGRISAGSLSNRVAPGCAEAQRPQHEE
jgi:peptidoglycan hydrolase-like protein with peptidoglycan-binding domain